MIGFLIKLFLCPEKISTLYIGEKMDITGTSSFTSEFILEFLVGITGIVLSYQCIS
jgi:hypothetical protein